MLIGVAFIASAVAMIAAWLATQRLASRPWLEQGDLAHAPEIGAVRAPAANLGVGVLLAVVGALFSLLFSAYLMSADLGDWTPSPLPRLLWLNTAILAWSSIALQTASGASRRAQDGAAAIALAAAGVAALAFLVGQAFLLAQVTSGERWALNPSYAFLYLVIGLHGLHLAGGVIALGRAGLQAWRAPARARGAIGLCAVYWHFLLAVWLIFIGLASGAWSAFAGICRQLIS